MSHNFMQSMAGQFNRINHVLLVGDMHSDIALIRRALARIGATVHLEVLQDRRIILERIGAADGKTFVGFALILVDMNMTKVDGYELVETVRKSPFSVDTPVVAISSLFDEAELRRNYKLGVNSFVHKSPDCTIYAQSLYEICSYWLNQQVLATKSFHSAG